MMDRPEHKPKAILLFTIEDVFEMKDRGCIVVPGIPDPSPTIPALKPGTPIKLRRPDGTEISTTIRDVEIIRLGHRQPYTPIILQGDIKKGDIPIGTEVWYFRQEDDAC